jgi:hypothetical protein
MICFNARPAVVSIYVITYPAPGMLEIVCFILSTYNTFEPEYNGVVVP